MVFGVWIEVENVKVLCEVVVFEGVINMVVLGFLIYD